jgi:ubiquinone/menaquinone biosynthesis C-methylase UbiE
MGRVLNFPGQPQRATALRDGQSRGVALSEGAPPHPMRASLLTFLVLAFSFHGAAHAVEPDARPAEARYETRAKHSRDGIGKFYFGREIAHVMGHQGADWLERPEREQEERPDLLLEALALKPGEVVADIGAGSGYLSWRMAQRVGEKGKVHAVEIQQEFLDLIMVNMKKRGVGDIVVPTLGTVQDPKLPANSCDLIIMVDVYHEFDFPYEMTRAMIRGLKPGGRIVFVEYRGEDPEVPIKPLHKMTLTQVKKEMTVHPELKFAESIETLPRQRVIVFRKS